MKYFFLFSILLAYIFISCGSEKPDALTILKKAREKSQSIENAKYEVTWYKRYQGENDTFINRYTCSFKRTVDDYLSPFIYHFQEYLKDETPGNKTYVRESLYSGTDFIHTTHDDSTGELLSKAKWANQIEPYIVSSTFLFSPYIDDENSLYPKNKEFFDPRYRFNMLGEEQVNNYVCFHISINKIPDDENIPGSRNIKNERDFWIEKDNHYLVQYSEEYNIVNEKDTMFQYERFSISNYEFNKPQDENIYSLNSIPAFYKIREYTPNRVLICGKRSDQIMKDTIAPDWKLKTLSDQTLSLKETKGQLVVLDFFYKNCSPCIQALPALQALSEKYKEKGLRVIGIDPKDKKEDMVSFLKERGVNYTVLLCDEKLARDYLVSGYPTIYLVDRNGKIIYTQAGYGKGSEEELEEIIKRNL
jgi:thiol-disulfide isomerase/thioredoxin